MAEDAARSLIVFAGGRATRLGGVNKALLEVGGMPIIERILDTLGPLVDERLALGQAETLAGMQGIRAVPDPEPHAGVLPALANGLAAASGTVCLAVACDMPFVSRPLFEHALHVLDAEDVDVVIPRDAEGLQPMHAVYRRESVLAAVRAALARSDQRMISYFKDVRVRELLTDEARRFDPDLHAFMNVNTPDDLALAQRLA